MNASEPVNLAASEPVVERRPRRSRPPVAGRSLIIPSGDFEGAEMRVMGLVRALARRVRRRPGESIAVALVGGFVLGGALSFRAGRIAAAAAARHVGRELLKQLL
jgi:hypothetical protein